MKRQKAGRQEEAGIKGQVEILVEKIRVKGEVSFRDLQRSYNRATVDTLKPILNHAVEMGLVMERYRNGHCIPE